MGEGCRGTVSAYVRVHRAPQRAPDRVWGCALIQGHPGSRQGGRSVSWERPPNTNRPLLTVETGAGGRGGRESRHPAEEAQTAVYKHSHCKDSVKFLAQGHLASRSQGPQEPTGKHS